MAVTIRIGTEQYALAAEPALEEVLEALNTAVTEMKIAQLETVTPDGRYARLFLNTAVVGSFAVEYDADHAGFHSGKSPTP